MNTTDQQPRQDGARPTIVLVHGAFADASSWSSVIERLQQRGYTVIAPANPLRGVAADSAYIASQYVHRTISGVGHNLPQEAPRAFIDAVLEVDRY
jgi:pimeloyl-ACP methyl ester carboxylesterase